MRPLKAFSDWLIYGNFWIATGAAALTWQTYYLLNLPVQPKYILLAFAATFFIYNVDRLVSFKSISGVKSERHIWITTHARYMLFFTLACTILLVAFVFFLPWHVLIFLAHMGIISVGYSIPFMGSRGNRRSLKSIKSLKIFLISYVWMAATAWLPAIGSLGAEGLLSFDVQMIALKRALFIFAVTLPFDIRDYESDKKTGVATLPILIGVQKTKMLSLLCIFLFCAIAFLQFYPERNNILAALLVSGVLSGWYAIKASNKKHEYYYTGLLDAMLPLQAVLVWLAQEFVNFR